MAKEMPTREQLLEIFTYNRSMGVLYWNARPQTSVTGAASWNTKYSGTLAGVVNQLGYRVITIRPLLFYAHRLIWKIETDTEPFMLDHINGNRSDNHISNLRVCDANENLFNRGKLSNNKSGFKSVIERNSSVFEASVKTRGKTTYLGKFASAAEAHEAYCAAAKIQHGKFFNSGEA